MGGAAQAVVAWRVVARYQLHKVEGAFAEV